MVVDSAKLSSLCELCNPARYDDPEWIAIHHQLERYSVDKHLFTASNGGHVLRKGWEWTHCIYGLTKLGSITEFSRGLGVGAGREPVIFFLSNHIGDVTALNLYGNETWASSDGCEATMDVIEHPER